MGLFGPTVRDFSKSREGRELLNALFNYDAIPAPKLIRIESVVVFDKGILGRAVEHLLQLVIERQNPNFDFEFRLGRRFGNSKFKEEKEIKRYLASGELSDGLLECLILLGKKRQKAFEITPSKSKNGGNDELKTELRRIHQLASLQKWNVEEIFYQGWLTDGRIVTAQADLLTDSKLIEVKTTEDVRKHDENLSQLFCYYLLSQAPMRKLGTFSINELGIYYARHGVLVGQSVSALVKFPLNRAARTAFDFAADFSKWRTRKIRHKDDSNHAMWELIRELCPRPPWVAEIIEKYSKVSQKDFYSGKHTPIPRIILPKNFLLTVRKEFVRERYNK